MSEEKDAVLFSIRQRILKAQQLKGDGPYRTYETEEEMFNAMRQLFTRTSIARSEYFILPEQIMVLEEKINKTREKVLQYGLPFTIHQDYEDFIKNNAITYEDAKNRYFLILEEIPLEVEADLFPLLSVEPQKKLWFYINDENHELFFNIDFNDIIDLMLFFKKNDDKKRIDAEYNTDFIPIKNITDEEYMIISYYLDDVFRILKENFN